MPPGTLGDHMGYACPVCGDPQADAGHLANHLAITAIARGGDHEAWLDEEVPDWEELGEDALADAVVPEAAETDYPQVFEDTTGEATEDARDHGVGETGSGPADAAEDLPVDVADPRRSGGGAGADLDAATREALERARELQAEGAPADDETKETETNADESETE